jgi:molybdopterin-guanine dinucleotide biosynthesis protein
MNKEEEEELEQSGYNIGYNAADDLLTLFDDESQDIIIKGFIEGFNEWGIGKIKIIKTGEDEKCK